MPPTNAQYDSQLEMLAVIVESKANTGKEAAEIIRSFKTEKPTKPKDRDNDK